MISKFFAYVSCCLTFSQVAFADSHSDRIRQCERADAVCVGLVLLDAIKAPSSAATARTVNGYLEVFHDNEWRGVCDDSFDEFDGRVACREMGMSYVSWTTVSGGSSFWLDDLACSGQESSLATCPNSGWGTHNCGAGENVGLICQ